MLQRKQAGKAGRESRIMSQIVSVFCPQDVPHGYCFYEMLQPLDDMYDLARLPSLPDGLICSGMLDLVFARPASEPFADTVYSDPCPFKPKPSRELVQPEPGLLFGPAGEENSAGLEEEPTTPSYQEAERMLPSWPASSSTLLAAQPFPDVPDDLLVEEGPASLDLPHSLRNLSIGLTNATAADEESRSCGGDSDDPAFDPTKEEHSDGREARRSLRPRRRASYSDSTVDEPCAFVREKGKIGRPIAYRGDPNDPRLSEDDKRRIKRRIANRESARRVRQKRQDGVQELRVQIDQMHAHNEAVMSHCREVQQNRAGMAAQLQEAHAKLQNVYAAQQKLQLEVRDLRLASKVKAQPEASAAACGESLASSFPSPKISNPMEAHFSAAVMSPFPSAAAQTAYDWKP